MKPAPFAYHAPQTLDEALELLSEGHARVLAGGQSLVPLMKMRLARPSILVDVNGVAGLDGLAHDGGELRIGAVTRQQALADDEEVARSQPLLRAAGLRAGYLATRHRGTVGGSLAHAAPWAELTAAAGPPGPLVAHRPRSGGTQLSWVPAPWIPARGTRVNPLHPLVEAYRGNAHGSVTGCAGSRADLRRRSRAAESLPRRTSAPRHRRRGRRT